MGAWQWSLMATDIRKKKDNQTPMPPHRHMDQKYSLTQWNLKLNLPLHFYCQCTQNTGDRRMLNNFTKMASKRQNKANCIGLTPSLSIKC